MYSLKSLKCTLAVLFHKTGTQAPVSVCVSLRVCVCFGPGAPSL